MKRILIAIAIILLTAIACCPNQNCNTVTPEEMASNAAAYDSARNAPVDVSKFKKGHVVSVDKYGNKREVCTAFYGEFNGHTWFVFYDNLEVPAVQHDPLCACGGGKVW